MDLPARGCKITHPEKPDRPSFLGPYMLRLSMQIPIPNTNHTDFLTCELLCSIAMIEVKAGLPFQQAFFHHSTRTRRSRLRSHEKKDTIDRAGKVSSTGSCLPVRKIVSTSQSRVQVTESRKARCSRTVRISLASMCPRIEANKRSKRPTRTSTASEVVARSLGY